MNLGYACINQTLAQQKVQVNRSMIRRTFDEKGLNYVSELIQLNLTDLLQILKWNHTQNISFYRMSSEMFPWMSEYQLEELPQFSKIQAISKKVGELANQYNMRLTFHPGPFNVLASENEKVVNNTIYELDQHSKIMDLMGLSISPNNKINIHVGTTAGGDKARAMQNFCENFLKLQPNTQKRLTIENDDKPNMFTVEDLYAGISKKVGIPIVFDYHHHFCNPGQLTQEAALKMAVSTWPEDIVPVVHYSEPKSLDDKKLIRAHADFVEKEINTYGIDVDIMLEAKEKERALIRYRRNYNF